MKYKHLPLFLCLLPFLLGCDSRIRDSSQIATFTPVRKATIDATPNRGDASGVAVAFYNAWEEGNYAGMYPFLSARSKQLISEQEFIEQYKDAIQNAQVTEVNTDPLSALQEGNTAELVVRVIWQTALVGTIEREHLVPMQYDGRTWAIVWDTALILPELAGGKSLRLQVSTPERGTIYDRSGQEKFAYQTTGIAIGMIPNQITDESGFLSAMSPLLGKSAEQIKAIYQNQQEDWYIPLGVVTEEKFNANSAALEPFLASGVQTSSISGRMYSAEGAFAHTTGFMQFLTAENQASYLAKGYGMNDKIGASGVEAIAEESLSGIRGGQLFIVSPAGIDEVMLAESRMQDGRDVFTTFDAQLQRLIHQALQQAIVTHPHAEKGSVVMMDVNSGAIRAIATYPSYDGSLFSDFASGREGEIETLFNNPAQPMVHRPIQGTYPPGSVFKLVTYAAGYESGKFSPNSTYYCSGTWAEAGEALRKYDWYTEGHQTITAKQGIERSCNPWAYHIGWTLHQDDPTTLSNMATQFGYGQPSNIGLAEATGINPSPQWKINTYGEEWVAGDAINLSIGQGFLEATPLQVTNMTAAIANGGTLYQPHLIERMEETVYAPTMVTKPIEIRKIKIAPYNVTALQEAMYDVTSTGWGTAAHQFVGLNVATAGKTGTAQVAGDDALPHSWFTGYFPYEAPEVAVTVLMENAGEGSAVAAPVFRRAVELYFGYEITPYPWE